MMTPALKAMVAAMAASIDSQLDGDPEAGFVENPDGQKGHYVQGVFDLEKVARAGLEAIRDASLAVEADEAVVIPESIERWWPELIDVVLEETAKDR